MDVKRYRMRHRGALHERQGSDQDHAGVREPRVRVEGDDLVGVDFQDPRSRLLALESDLEKFDYGIYIVYFYLQGRFDGLHAASGGSATLD